MKVFNTLQLDGALEQAGLDVQIDRAALACRHP